MHGQSLTATVEALIAKHSDSPLAARWRHAVSFGLGAMTDAVWIRNTEELVNLVWLNKDGIRDISWFPEHEQSVFNFFALDRIGMIEVREGPKLARSFGFEVDGDLLARVYSKAGEVLVVWAAASDEESKQSLTSFVSVVLSRLTE